MRYLVSGGILLVTLAWLVLSYLPGVTGAFPRFVLNSSGFQSLLPWLAGATLACFLLIQLDLVRATARWFQRSAPGEIAHEIAAFELRRGAELFWTVLPVVGTVMLTVWLVMVSQHS